MRTILCISTDRSRLISLHRLFHSHGYQCITASSEDEAERNFVMNSVDMLVVDGTDHAKKWDVLSARLNRLRPVRSMSFAPNSRTTETPRPSIGLDGHMMDEAHLLAAVEAYFQKLTGR